MLRFSFAPWVAVFLAAGCSAGGPLADSDSDAHGGTSASDATYSDVSVETSCNPLTTHPTTLATILGVGKDHAGTLYVADQGAIAMYPSIVRVFVAVKGELVRQDIIGSSEIGSSEYVETFESADGSGAPRDLEIQLDGGKATLMTLGPEGSAKAAIDGLDAGAASALTLVSSSTVQGMPAIDLPGAVQYVADSTGGGAIVVTAPLEDDLGSAAFHLFYGTPGDMIERPIVSFNQSESGWPTIGFTVGSSTYLMDVTCGPFDDSGVSCLPGPVTLTEGDGGNVTFTLRLPTPTTLAGFTFTCLGA